MFGLLTLRGISVFVLVWDGKVEEIAKVDMGLLSSRTLGRDGNCPGLVWVGKNPEPAPLHIKFR